MKRGLRPELLGYDDVEVMPGPFDMAPDVSEDLGHQRDIENVGDVSQPMPTRRQQGGGHLLQDCILGAEDSHRSTQGGATLGDDLTHCLQCTGRRSEPDGHPGAGQTLPYSGSSLQTATLLPLGSRK